MNWIRFGVYATFAWVGTGCVGSNVETTPLNSPPHPLAARAAGSVEVYMSSPPARRHVDVALLRANQANYGDVDTQKMVRALLEQAANIGCDAIFISGAAQREGTQGDWHLLDPGSNSLLATCIVYVPDATPASAPANTVAGEIRLAPTQ